MNIHEHNLYANGVLAMDEHRMKHEYYYLVMEEYSYMPMFRILINLHNKKYPKWNTFGKLGYWSAELIYDFLESMDSKEAPSTNEFPIIIKELEWKYNRMIENISEVQESSFNLMMNMDKYLDYENYTRAFEKFKKKYANEVYYDFESEIPIPFDFR